MVWFDVSWQCLVYNLFWRNTLPWQISRTVKQAVEIWNYVDRMAEDRVEPSPTAGGVATRQEEGDQAALLRDKQRWPWAQVGREP